MAEHEAETGGEIGAGMPDHPLHAPEYTPTPTIPAGMVARADVERFMRDAFIRGYQEARADHPDDDSEVSADLYMIGMEFSLAAAPKQAEQQGMEIARLREALAAEDDYWAASRAHASAIARIRPQTQAVFDAATRRRDAARAALNAPTGAVEKGAAK